jgi:hypothetical protein
MVSSRAKRGPSRFAGITANFNKKRRLCHPERSIRIVAQLLAQQSIQKQAEGPAFRVRTGNRTLQ